MRDTVLFSIATNGFDIFFEDCIRSHRRYAEKFGYDYLLFSRIQGFDANASSWLKLPLLVKLLGSKYQNAMFVDADCFIRDHCPDFRAELCESSPIRMSLGWSGRINAGVILATNSTELKADLRDIISHCETPVPDPHKAPFENGHVIAKFHNSPLWYALDSRWNSIVNHNKSDFIWHYTGPSARPKSSIARIRVFFATLPSRLLHLTKDSPDFSLEEKIDSVSDLLLSSAGVQ